MHLQGFVPPRSIRFEVLAEQVLPLVLRFVLDCRTSFHIVQFSYRAFLPVALLQLDWTCTYEAIVHLTQCFGQVGGVREADESVPFRDVVLLVHDDLGGQEGRVLLERLRQHLVRDFFAKVSHEQPCVVGRPRNQRRIHPRLAASCASHGRSHDR
eukprot:scaffold633_cov321-Pavlova_lutheri.AAC.14